MDDELADLFEAARLIRMRAGGAVAAEGERWTADTTESDGLVVGAYQPADVQPDGSLSTGCVAFLGYPADPQGRAHAHALPAAWHMAGADPQFMDTIAAWLETHYADLSSASGNLDQVDSPGDTQRAIHAARVYLRKTV
jgi:hypothetical protein